VNNFIVEMNIPIYVFRSETRINRKNKMKLKAYVIKDHERDFQRLMDESGAENPLELVNLALSEYAENHPAKPPTTGKAKLFIITQHKSGTMGSAKQRPARPGLLPALFNRLRIH